MVVTGVKCARGGRGGRDGWCRRALAEGCRLGRRTGRTRVEVRASSGVSVNEMTGEWFRLAWPCAVQGRADFAGLSRTRQRVSNIDAFDAFEYAM